MRIFFLALLLATAGCGSDYDGERPIGQGYPGAVYEGTITSSDSNVIFSMDPAVAIATQDGYIEIYTGGMVISGRLILQGDSFDVIMNVNALPGFTFSDGSSQKKMRLIGTITNGEGTRVATGLIAQFIMDPEAEFVYSYEVDGSIELTGIPSDSVLDPGASEIAGTYTDGTTTITFSTDGTFTGQDMSGCIFNGSYSIPDYEFNAYRLGTVQITCNGETSAGTGNAAFKFDTASMQYDLLLIGKAGQNGFFYQFAAP